MFQTLSRMKFVIDVSTWVVMLVLVGLLSKENDDYFRKRVPVAIDIFTLHPYATYTDVGTFFTDHVYNKKICESAFNATVCTNWNGIDKANILANVQEHVSSCSATDPRPPMCTKCVDDYAQRIYNFGQLANMTGKTVVATESMVTVFKNNLTSCIFREAKYNTVAYMFSTNVWIHLMWWCSMSAVFSLLLSVDNHKSSKGTDNKQKSMWFVYIVGGVIYVTSIVCYILYSWWINTDSMMFDLVVLMLYILISLVLGVAWMTFGRVEKTDTAMELWGPVWDNLVFDTNLLLAVPAVTVVVCALRGWTSYDMLMYMITTVLTLVTCTMVRSVI